MKGLLCYYGPDLPAEETFVQEVRLWKRQWNDSHGEEEPAKLKATLQHKFCNPRMFPNIHRILYQLLLCPVTSAGVKRANSSLGYIKNVYWSTMKEDRLNALILLFFTEIYSWTLMLSLICMPQSTLEECFFLTRCLILYSV